MRELEKQNIGIIVYSIVLVLVFLGTIDFFSIRRTYQKRRAKRVAWKRAGYDAAELQGDGRITASQLGYFILRS